MPLLKQLGKDFPDISFISGERFSWVPHKRTIVFGNLTNEDSNWSLLHELGHATLGHKGYRLDIELLQLEVEAWERAVILSADYKVTIPWQHIEQCIDSYRDWLHARSTCPECRTVSFQPRPLQYTCHNCNTTWRVSKSRLCRIHRRLLKQKQPL